MGAYNKFKAIPEECPRGHMHPSKKESARCAALCELETTGKITHLEQQPSYQVTVDGKPICKYVADFRYRMADSGLLIVEDVKGVTTPIFNLKRKLVEATYPGTVISIYPPKKRKARKAKKVAA
jgi:hypothetical protein